jgi:rhamnosyl/mannosyltransferase
VLKVLHIGKFFTPFRGGVENYMRDAMVALSRLGITNVAVVHHHDLSKRSVDDIIDVEGIPFHVIRAGTWLKFMYTPISPMFPILMRRLARLHRPDVIHFHMPNPSAFWALVMIRTRRTPWVIHWHADVVASAHDPRLRWFYKLYRPLEQMMLRRAAAVIVTSQAYLDHSEPLQPFRDKCRVVPLGLDAAQVNLEREADLAKTYREDPRFKVLAIGRLTYYKGFEFLVRAAARLKKNIRVDIVGTGDREDDLKRLVKDLDLQDQVHLRGRLPDVHLHAMLDACDSVCLPSIERTEAFGMVLLEAMLHGKPTVISDVPGSGMGWIVEDEGTGIKVPPADEEKLARALAWLRDHPNRAREMGQRGRQRFDESFSIEQSAQALIRVYREINVAPGNGQGAS